MAPPMTTAAERFAVADTRTDAASGISARTRGLLAIAAVYLLIWACPHPSSVDAAGWRQFAVFVATLAGLILQPLPAAAMVFVGLMGSVILGGRTIERTLAGFGEASEWLLLGAMFMARVLTDTGL